MGKKVPKGEFLFLEIILFYVAYYFWSIKEYAVKAVLWPYCLMVAAVIAVINVAIELLRKSPSNDCMEVVPTVSPREQVKAKMPILVVIVSIIAYTLLLKTLGLHICNFLLIFFMVLYLTRGRWKLALLTAAVMTLGFYIVFDLALGMRLPRFKLF